MNTHNELLELDSILIPFFLLFIDGSFILCNTMSSVCLNNNSLSLLNYVHMFTQHKCQNV